MLILTRKEGESIRIGDNISIKIVSMDGHNCKIGVDAPRSISVNREEVYLKIKAENQTAATADTNIAFDSVAGLLKGKDTAIKPNTLSFLTKN
jgi:carbon storage regulator